MKKEDKDLLLRYLSMALPYNVICFKNVTNCHPGDSVLLEEDIYSLRTGNPTEPYYGQHDYYRTVVLELKPYLRPMSSMTEEEEKEYNILCNYNNNEQNAIILLDWLLKKHFDFMSLIPKGLAIEVTEENNPYNIKEE